VEPVENLETQEPEAYGCVGSQNTSHVSNLDREILNVLSEKGHKNVSTTRISWPTRDVKPTNDFSDEQLFCKAFPWLFPGGVGDFNDIRKTPLTEADWAENLLHNEDGRFARDKLWCFFTLNYIYRHRNMSQSRFFVKDFLGEEPPTLEELKEQISNGNMEFVDKLMYYSKNVSGSAAYWRSKKAELYSWINHHIETGAGPPTVFITFSCAEYFWPDVKRLLEEYILLCEGKKVDLDKDFSAWNKAVNDYTLVIQEFFHSRIESYLKSIGFNVLGMKHYWARFEFAKSRGQIHLHLLGILPKASEPGGIYDQLWELKGDKQTQAEKLGEWARSVFNMTAEHSGLVNVSGEEKYSPCKRRFSQVKSIELDRELLCDFCQIHECNGYCLRSVKVNKHTDTTTTTNVSISSLFSFGFPNYLHNHSFFWVSDFFRSSEFYARLSFFSVFGSQSSFSDDNTFE
jgi:hypothetical protein